MFERVGREADPANVKNHPELDRKLDLGNFTAREARRLGRSSLWGEARVCRLCRRGVVPGENVAVSPAKGMWKMILHKVTLHRGGFLSPGRAGGGGGKKIVNFPKQYRVQTFHSKLRPFLSKG